MSESGTGIPSDRIAEVLDDGPHGRGQARFTSREVDVVGGEIYIDSQPGRLATSLQNLTATPNEEITMFGWAIAFFIIAIIAAVLGFGGIAAGAAGIAQVVFWIALVLAVIGFFVGRTRV